MAVAFYNAVHETAHLSGLVVEGEIDDPKERKRIYWLHDNKVAPLMHGVSISARSHRTSEAALDLGLALHAFRRMAIDPATGNVKLKRGSAQHREMHSGYVLCRTAFLNAARADRWGERRSDAAIDGRAVVLRAIAAATNAPGADLDDAEAAEQSG